jgi:hypothetical protein
MSSYHHRTSGGISDELTDAQRLEISQRLLAREVSNACVAWLDARGFVSKGFNRHHPADAAQGIVGAIPGAPSKVCTESTQHRDLRRLYASPEKGKSAGVKFHKL